MLSTELYEFQCQREKTDEEIARRLIENRNRNQPEVLIAGAKALVEESAMVLQNFDLRFEEFAYISNLVALQNKEAARAWLKKMNGLWAETLRELESMNDA